MINELVGRLNKEGKDIAASPVSAAQLGAILDLIAEGTISGKIAKDLFEIVWSEGGDPRAIVEARGMKQVTDLSAIEKVVDEIIAKNPDKVGAGEDEPEADRLVRRPGDEGVRRQGQSAGGERSAQAQARPLTHELVASDAGTRVTESSRVASARCEAMRERRREIVACGTRETKFGSVSARASESLCADSLDSRRIRDPEVPSASLSAAKFFFTS